MSEEPRETPVPIAHDDGSLAEARLVEDSLQGVRSTFLHPVTEPLPADETSAAAERGDHLDPDPPLQDAALAPERPSVWEAAPRDDDDPVR